jgi:hypothetical protein
MKPTQEQFDDSHKHDWEAAENRPDMIAAPKSKCKTCGMTSRVYSEKDLNK